MQKRTGKRGSWGAYTCSLYHITAAREGISIDGATLYCVYSPCLSCCNMIKTAGIIKVLYEEIYDGYPDGPIYLESIGVCCNQFKWGKS